MQPTPPFWFRLRQGAMESVAPEMYHLSAPNAAEAFIGIRPGVNGSWRPYLRLQKDGPDADAPEIDLATPQDAWEAAFELYRVRIVV